MKRLPILLLYISISIFLVMLLIPCVANAAQTTGSATPGAPPTVDSVTVQDVLKAAQQAKANADAANTQANNVVNNANNAVNTVNLLLNFIQAASLFGGVLASVFAILGTRIGARTLSDYREELKKAQAELEAMHKGLNQETEQVREQAARAIRALALMQLGEQQLERHNVKGSLQMYQQAYALDPDNGAINYFLGELYIQDRQIEKGVEHLQKSLKADPDYAPTEAALGFALRLRADSSANSNERDLLYAKAEERLLRALQIDAMALDIHGEPVQAALGALYKRQNRLDQAVRAYQAAYQIAPQKSYPVINLAQLNYRQGRVLEARPYFEKVKNLSTRALEINAQDYWARLDRLTANLALGQIKAAMDDLETALQQITTISPLETILRELTHMRNAPQPLMDADSAIAVLTDVIATRRA